MSRNILVCQLNRIGDLLQTKIAIDCVKNQNADFTLVARRKMVAPIEVILNKSFKRIIYFEDLSDDIIQKLNTPVEFSLFANLSYDKESLKLGSKFNRINRIGPFYTEDQKIVISDKWSQVIFSNVLDQKYSGFNLIDLFKLVIMGDKVFSSDFPLQEKDLNINQDKSSSLHIAVAPFSSSERKTLPINTILEALNKLNSSQKIHLHLLGSKDEKVKVDEQKLEGLEYSLHFGLNDIELFNLFENQIDAFLGMDSFLAHYAALWQIPSIISFLGTSQVRETAPYNQNALILAPRSNCYPCHFQSQCQNYVCHHDIDSQTLLSALNFLFSDNAYENLMQLSSLHRFHLYNPYFEQGILKVSELTQNPSHPDHLFQDIYQIIWPLYIHDQHLALSRKSISKEIKKSIIPYFKALELLFELYDHAEEESKALTINAVRKEELRIPKNIQRLQEIDKLTDQLTKEYPALKGIAQFVFTSKSNVLGEHLEIIAKSYEIEFQGAKLLIQIFQELLENYTQMTLKENSSSNTL